MRIVKPWVRNSKRPVNAVAKTAVDTMTMVLDQGLDVETRIVDQALAPESLPSLKIEVVLAISVSRGCANPGLNAVNPLGLVRIESLISQMLYLEAGLALRHSTTK